MQGLLGAINKSPEKSLICVFTDNGSKDLELGRDILKKKRDKRLTVYIVLTPGTNCIKTGLPGKLMLSKGASIHDVRTEGGGGLAQKKM